MKSKKEEIINYATELFMTQGYVSTSTRQIAMGLNITQPAIYHHFKNKEDIYVNVLTNFTEEIGSELAHILKKEVTPEKKLFEMSDYLIKNHSINFSLMMKDMKEELSEKSQQQIFMLWNDNYFKPFKYFFENLDKKIKKDYSAEQVSLHYLRVLSAYMNDNTYSNNQLPIEELITIFFYGIF
ncbi:MULTISPECIES: TetR/AcrR family transcriptional regulator [Vagococcus]|uniref:Transcriptional regulator, TetR family n=1 Tax=Vagococcus fluvialis bH819 TaxID=1255619 RepID=A0A1X6WM58_9ENTE|nr:MULTISPECIES: TetR/AcrR family transcriptional regulator [Vagococcus]SLM85423.1 Transcriptional regulator, TetR family [Vagococcus fluvialis bH819]HCM89284.1 TetR/AcrR family transcriptional regulator [Vagococcus sp.]